MFHLHDPAVFPDPLDFNPRRWLVPDTTEMQRNFGNYYPISRLDTHIYRHAAVKPNANVQSPLLMGHEFA